MSDFPKQISVLDHDATIRTRPDGDPGMLIHEALARSRQREAERAAADYRRARRLTAGRLWSRLAAWAARRGDRAHTAAVT